jgi:hypothetical protein
VTQSRKHLSAKGLLSLVRDKFKNINQPRVLAKRSAQPIKLEDCLMSGLAIFGMKFSSLLQFEEQAKEGGITKRNLRTLYQVDQVPSDTYMRERLDEVNPREVRKTYKTVFAQVQRGKVLEDFAYMDGHYLMPMDMTGFFSSPNIHCENCCVKQHNRPKLTFVNAIPADGEKFKSDTYLLFVNMYIWQLFYVNGSHEIVEINLKSLPELKAYLLGRSRQQVNSSHVAEITEMIEAYHEEQHGSTLTYYHNMMCAAIVHPDIKIVLPFAPEPVWKTDGTSKNDCEQNSAKRILSDIRREHPHLKLIAVQDAIGATAPNLLEFKFANVRFIVGVKPDNHKDLFNLAERNAQTYQHTTDDGKTHRYRYMNKVPLNRTTGFEINFLEYWETDKNGEVQHFSWVTDIQITNENAYQLMRGGRANWRIENNTFNTLKNQGYHFSHNFGHGYQHLCTVFGMLMMLAFFIDQVQEYCCDLFKGARRKFRTRIGLWQKMKSLFLGFTIASWEDLFNAIAYGYKEVELTPNTS